MRERIRIGKNILRGVLAATSLFAAGGSLACEKKIEIEELSGTVIKESYLAGELLMPSRYYFTLKTEDGEEKIIIVADNDFVGGGKEFIDYQVNPGTKVRIRTGKEGLKNYSIRVKAGNIEILPKE